MSSAVIQILSLVDPEPALARAAAALDAGGLVVLPTETVYGTAARLDRPPAIARLRALRGGDAKPWTVHLARPEQAWEFVTAAGELPRRLVKKLWPGPVGLIFDVAPDRQKLLADRFGVAPADLFENDTITLRCPDHPVFADIVDRVNGPVVLTRFDAGASSLPRDLDLTAHGVDLAIDAGPTRFSKPSTLLRAFPDRYEIVRTGVYDARIIERLLKTMVLFVCSGNTCRSPMAEALARKILADQVGGEDRLDAQGITVASAGVYALSGTRATPQAVEAVGGMGADLSRHRSQGLTPELLHAADVVFTMGRSHAMAARAMSHGATVVPLDPAGDIEDPIGSDVATYRNLAGQMEKLIADRLAEHNIAGVGIVGVDNPGVGRRGETTP